MWMEASKEMWMKVMLWLLMTLLMLMVGVVVVVDDDEVSDWCCCCGLRSDMRFRNDWRSLGTKGWKVFHNEHKG